MANRQRLVLLGLAVAVAVVAVIAIGSGGGDEDSGVIDTRTTPAAQTTATTDTTTTEEPQQAKPRPEVPVVRVRGGEPVGEVQTLRFRKGGDIVFDVRADAAGHAHLHGYDILKDLVPGKSVRFEARASIDGRFELELEDTATLIAEIEVVP